ncbi:hypothetical protein JXA47_01990 [Candidatus Sumerlaeota bacterium]|nr:hypothetical protein [Candidatus Sumerlaeota bacterium]
MGKAAIAVAAIAAAGFLAHSQMSDEEESVASSSITQAESATSAEERIPLPGPVKLVWHRDPGEVHRVHSVERVTMDARPDTPEIPAQHQEGINESVYIHRVTETGDDGSVVVEMVEYDVDGSPTGVRRVMWVEPPGRITRVDEVRGDSDVSQRLFTETVAMALSGFPEGPILPGESWTQEIVNPRFPEARVVAVSTLERLEERAGRAVAVISREMNLEIPTAIPWPSMVDNDPSMHAEISGVRAHTTMESQLLLDGMVPLQEIYQVELESRAHVTGQTPDGPLDITGSVALRIEGEMNLIPGG